MSRRTKLIIFAVFLVLLAVPAAHVARIWSVHEPLRFRLVSQSGPVMVTTPSGDEEELRYEIEATNVTDVPIEIYFVELMSRVLPELPEALFVLQGAAGTAQCLAPAYYGEVIQAHSTVKFTCHIRGPHPAIVPSVRPEIMYMFETRPRAGISDASAWLQRHLPESWGSMLPNFEPSFVNTPLEISSSANADHRAP
ncbi:MAG: hypothetical protein ACAH88_14315 [Roseimicrobium sp.]